MKRRILFVAENVTLAQVVRLAKLASYLDPTRYDVHFACSDFDPMVFGDLDCTRHLLDTIDPARVDKSLRSGKRIYDERTIMRYVRADLELIERVQPELVVGDFRLSLAISGPVSGTLTATLINAYWSPFRSEPGFPVPDHPIVRLLGEELTEQYFPRALPRVFEYFAAPINSARRRYGLPRIGSLAQVLTYGDYTLYPDTPQLVPTENLPPSHVYLGPVLWAPRLELDPELMPSDANEPLIYVTLGSSGRVDVLPTVLKALGRLGVKTVLATAGRAQVSSVPPNVVCRKFVPGNELCARASVVVTNGGSTSGYQALAQGTPVLGIPSNLDQYLAMQAITRRGAGLLEKARCLDEHALVASLKRLLSEPSLTTLARSVQDEFRALPSDRLFQNFVERALYLEGRAHA